jgi:hypothetical protein
MISKKFAKLLKFFETVFTGIEFNSNLENNLI